MQEKRLQKDLTEKVKDNFFLTEKAKTFSGQERAKRKWKDEGNEFNW